MESNKVQRSFFRGFLIGDNPEFPFILVELDSPCSLADGALDLLRDTVACIRGNGIIRRNIVFRRHMEVLLDVVRLEFLADPELLVWDFTRSLAEAAAEEDGHGLCCKYFEGEG